ncbi:AAA family ATPase [Tautonia sociabilis]|uniref:AAA+ ATPase domain-containing protein n=1 Tax=Tautonia sociabilis TaxID=2080755 RepID=A0A432MF93_9BACT|nr:AAA family ATPase [Tautonia sociabilis]RUL84647.1 hypothetical protein TsocGM_20050 [Tautonia sociabilis]
MHADQTETYRPLLETDPPAFLDRVNTPWDQAPDLEEYNQNAYKRILRALQRLARPGEASSTQGILVLGEAGTGKTHLLMRVARNLSRTNHILFVRKPNNEDAVAQHVWAEMIRSLSQPLALATPQQTQLDDLLAHVFSAVLIPSFEQDIEAGKDADQKRRWATLLRDDPYNLFRMLGEGEQRQKNMRTIRNRTLSYLQVNNPDVDQRIAHVLITYCFVSRADRKRVLLRWLSGQDIDEAEAKDLGLDPTWVKIDETSADVSTQQQREEQALRAIQSIGILSTYYQPLILAFDQLEGLRDQHRLSQRWGDTVREIFTMTPNLLVVTCIFPSLWESWFSQVLDSSVTERISQQSVTLETFGPRHGLKLLAAHLEPSFIKHRLPTNIYPFTEDAVSSLCGRAKSPRSFIQGARAMFEAWLDGDEEGLESAPPGIAAIVTQEAVDTLIGSTIEQAERRHLDSYDREIPIEQDLFGRIRNIVETLLAHSGERAAYDRATCGTKVMPPNLLVRRPGSAEDLCLCINNAEGNSFTARMRNLAEVMRSKTGPKTVILLRDRRCKAAGSKGQEYVETIQEMGGIYLPAGGDELSLLNAIYDALVDIEQHDLSIGTHEIDQRQFVEFLRDKGLCRRSQLLRHAAKLSEAFARAIGETHPTPAPNGSPSSQATAPPSSSNTAPTASGTVPSGSPSRENRSQESAPKRTPPPPAGRIEAAEPVPPVPIEVVVGDTILDSPSLGLIGRLKDGKRGLAVSFAKPQCLVVLGYMGSGKSYALGVLIESALKTVPNLSRHRKPMCVVAFNYRKNPEARFEHWGFQQPNSKPSEVDRLRNEYGAEPAGVDRINVFGFGPELRRRQDEFRGLPLYPIQFRPDELGAEHWEILMKPPSAQAEYMDVIRNIIQKLYYDERLTYKTLEKHILTDERLSPMQRQRAKNRLSFASKWLTDDRTYEWTEVLTEGSLNVFDLRMQALSSDDALKLCLVLTDLVRRAKNGVNKMVVFDEAHEYVDSKDLVAELENAITQIRHDGMSFVLASQFPDRIPARIFKYLLTRLIFKTSDRKAIDAIRKAAPNLEALSAQKVSNLDLEQGVCFIQTDDDCTDPLLKIPQLLSIRPRCSQHGGETVRNTGDP